MRLLINEAYIHLVDKTHPSWQDSAHFFAVAAQLMRRVMVDHARAHHAAKRGGAAVKVTLDETALVTQSRAAELLALDEALEQLAKFDPRLAQIVEMRYFGGLTLEEIAEVLKVHRNTGDAIMDGRESLALRGVGRPSRLREPERW